MAFNKNAQIRYNTLDKCFSNRFKKYFIEDLIEVCSLVLSQHLGDEISISRRQIFDDIQFMKSEAGYQAPIESVKDGKKVYYRYEDEKFTIANLPLDAEEIETLRKALFTLGRMSNTQGFEWVASLQTKLNAQLNFGNHSKIIDFEENEFLKGLHFLYPLYQYICNQQALLVTYKSFSSDQEKKFLLSPLYLKQFNNRWFLLSLGHRHQSVFTLAIDRIVSIQTSNEKYQPSDLDFQEYFEDIIGITNYPDQAVEEVVIDLSPAVVPYVQSKPLHGSQKLKGNRLTLQVKQNFELEGLILSYGENMKVIAPKSLKEKIHYRISKMQNNTTVL